MISEFEKLIYNKHLQNYKLRQNKPFKFKKNFENLNNDVVFYLKKLSLFFSKFKDINIDLFFLAPYKIYKDENFFDLKFYISPKAIKTYTLYKNQINKLDPDIEQNLIVTINSIKHIKGFCQQKNIPVTKYLEFVDTNQTIPSYIIDLQKQNINFYCLFGFEKFKFSIFKHYETYKYILGDIVDCYDVLYNNFIKSKKLKILVREGFKKIH